MRSLPRATLLMAALAAGCASSTTPADTGRSRTDGGSGTGDAGHTTDRDGGATTIRDAGEPTGDAGGHTRDAGGGHDAGRDAGPRMDAGPTCTPSAESCNAADDDCDGLVDEALSRGCSTACGSGTETCSSGSWNGCTAPAPAAETCNGADDDCDGTTDEGFRATVESTSYSSTLAAEHGGCDGSSQRMGPECNAAIHRHCGGVACTESGFGPVENSGDTAYVTCVDAEVRSTTFSTLATHHGVCDGSTERMGLNCNAAIHRYCAAAGFASGFGPVENAGDSANVTCVASAIAEVRSTTFTTLSTHHSGCDGSSERWGVNCNAAIHRYCAAAGFASGFGPVENSGDTAHVTCIRP